MFIKDNLPYFLDTLTLPTSSLLSLCSLPLSHCIIYFSAYSPRLFSLGVLRFFKCELRAGKAKPSSYCLSNPSFWLKWCCSTTELLISAILQCLQSDIILAIECLLVSSYCYRTCLTLVFFYNSPCLLDYILLSKVSSLLAIDCIILGRERCRTTISAQSEHIFCRSPLVSSLGKLLADIKSLTSNRPSNFSSTQCACRIYSHLLLASFVIVLRIQLFVEWLFKTVLQQNAINPKYHAFLDYQCALRL